MNLINRSHSVGNAPCYGCDRRHSLCHKDCKDYSEWSDAVAKVKQQKFDNSGYEYAAYVGEKINRAESKKQKNASSYEKKIEYRDKALYYERLCKEKLNEARILRERNK